MRWLVFAIALLFASPVEADLRAAMEATCQIRKVVVKNNKLTYASGGTGTIFHEDEDKVYVLTAAHVVDGNFKHLYLFFYNTGKSSHHILGKLEFRAYGKNGKDVAIVSVEKKWFNDYPIPNPVPIAKKGTAIHNGMRISSCGCPKLSWPSAWLGHVVSDRGGDTFRFSPKPIPGRSGSAVVDDDGRHILGIVIQYRSDGTGVAVSLKGIYKYTEDLKSIKSES